MATTQTPAAAAPKNVDAVSTPAPQTPPAAAAKPATTATDVAWTYSMGLSVMGVTAPLIHPLNVIAAGAAKTQTTTPNAASAVYKGLGGNPHNAMANYWMGISGHLSKELVRSFGRIGGFIYVEPYFKEHYSPNVAPHLLACTMATFEVLFANPADVWKSYRSTGLATTPADLFKGSLGNFTRQYMMWLVWSRSITPINTFEKEALGVDPTSKTGIAVRSVMQGGVCTLFTYPAELVLRTVQVRSGEYPVKSISGTIKFVGSCITNPALVSQGAYVSVVRDLVRNNGVRGLGLGMSAKMIGNTILLGGANYLPMFTAYMRGN